MCDVVLICGTSPWTVPSMLVVDPITNPPAGRYRPGHRRGQATSATVVESTPARSRSPTASVSLGEVTLHGIEPLGAQRR